MQWENWRVGKMNKRLFICADRNFPRGDAGSNRILFMAKALQEKGWKVIVISTGKRNKQDYNKEKDEYMYDGITYYNITFPDNKIKMILLNGISLFSLKEQIRAGFTEKQCILCIINFSIRLLQVQKILLQ